MYFTFTSMYFPCMWDYLSLVRRNNRLSKENRLYGEYLVLASILVLDTILALVSKNNRLSKKNRLCRDYVVLAPMYCPCIGTYTSCGQ